MTHTLRGISLSALACVTLTSLPALADDTYVPPPSIQPATIDSSKEDLPPSYIGIGILAGVSLTAFIDDETNDTIDPGLGWEGRVAIGTRWPVAFEASYQGTINGVDVEGADNLTLVGQGLDGKLRLNILPTYIVHPYIFAGVGWKHYTLADADAGEDGGSLAEGTDDLLELPVGAGIDFRYNYFLVDFRATYRPAFFADAEGDTASIIHADRDAISAGFSLGVEF